VALNPEPPVAVNRVQLAGLVAVKSNWRHAFWGSNVVSVTVQRTNTASLTETYLDGPCL
jgi:hypothetical protein